MRIPSLAAAAAVLFTLPALFALAAPPAAGAQEDPDRPVQGGGAGSVPAGWTARLDKASAGLANVKVAEMGDGLHVTLGPAIILYREGDRASGSYRLATSFTLTKPARHPEAYGLFIGGADLQGDGQRYTYFLIRQDGKFLVKRRTGAETQTAVDWTEHASVRIPEGEGSATNELAIEVGAERVSFLVNGTPVASVPKSEVDTQGTYGYRVNHNLDVHLAPIAITKASKSGT